MIEIVKKYIVKEQLIKDNDTIIVGVSGGADSICLLCVLKYLKDENVYKNINVIAVHINHSIRTTAMRDQEFTEAVCEKLNVPFYAVKVDVKAYVAENHVSTEEAGRMLRYKAFADIAKKVGVIDYKIAVAHNMNDNAETMIFNMVRGTGIKGLTGITSRRDNIIRPLLCVSRSQIEEYLETVNMTYCTDETNLQDDYSRNKIRHYIMPVCEAINEKFLDRFSELSNQVVEAEKYLALQTSDALEAVITQGDDGIIHISKEALEELDPYLQKRVLLEAVGLAAKVKKDIGATHVGLLLDLFALQVGKTISLPYEITAVREYDGVKLLKGKEVINTTPLEAAKLAIPGKVSYGHDYFFETRIYELNPEIPHIIPDSTFLKWFDYDKILDVLRKNGYDIRLRGRNEGDIICINNTADDKKFKKIKNYFIDEKIPAEMRMRIPLVAIDRDILWIAGYRASSEYLANSQTKNVLEIKCTLRKMTGFDN